ncbi:MAG: hypothetical protein RIQ53_4083 [Pseudomonadota bacterium]|jgi:hypothetical protein
MSLDLTVGVADRRGDLLSGLWQPAARFPHALDADGWHALLAQARAAQLLPRLAQRLGELARQEAGEGLPPAAVAAASTRAAVDAPGGAALVAGQAVADLQAVPPGPRAYLLSASFLVRRQEQGVMWELVQLQQALAGLGTRLVLLKGAAYLAAGLAAARDRTFGDIDILLAAEGLTEAETALAAAGWIAAERDPYNQRYYRQWMHELPPLEHIQRGTALDVHHTITPPTSAWRVDGRRLLEAAVPLPPLAPGLPPLYMLQPVDMVLHSATHLFGEGEFDHGLRDLLDLRALIGHFETVDSGFWPQLLQRARALGLGVPLWHALDQLQRLFGREVPAAQRAAVHALRPPAWRRLPLRALLAVGLRPHHPSARGQGEGLARWLLYVRSHALRMPLRLLLPHLLRKAWMQRFGETAAETGQPAADAHETARDRQV